jgi:crossover junction endodeoxyribonuclease RusA
MTVQFTLPMLPPSANRIWRRAGNRIHKSTAYAKWLRDSVYIAKAQQIGKVSGTYALSIQAVRPDRRRRDIDNLLKPASDLLVSLGIVRDDSDAEMISIRWVTTGPALTIRVSRAGVE